MIVNLATKFIINRIPKFQQEPNNSISTNSNCFSFPLRVRVSGVLLKNPHHCSKTARTSPGCCRPSSVSAVELFMQEPLPWATGQPLSTLTTLKSLPFISLRLCFYLFIIIFIFLYFFIYLFIYTRKIISYKRKC